MRKYFKFTFQMLALTAASLFAFHAFGDASPSPVPSEITSPTGLNGWLVLLAPLAVAVLDFVFAINSKAKSNGILHWLYLLAGGKETPPS